MHPPTLSQTGRAQQRFGVIRSEISGRLWRVHARMSSAAYNELIDHMSLVQLNGESRDLESGAHLEPCLSPLDPSTPADIVPPGGCRLLP